MIFLHTSDLHLGKRLHEASLAEEQRYILGEIRRIAKEKNCTAVVIAGDIYDKSTPSAEAVALFDWFVTSLYNDSIAVIANYGNHDSPDRTAYGSEILSKSGIHISPKFDGNIARAVFSDEFGSVVFHLLPFIKPVSVEAAYSDCFSSEAISSESDDLETDVSEDISSYDKAVRYVVETERNRGNIDPCARNVIVCHQYITGGERSESENVPVGGLDNISADIFDLFDYCALGHLHKPQRILRDTMRYSGSPLKYSLDEYNNEKSVAIVNLRQKGDVAVECVPLRPLHDIRRIKGAYDELTLRENYENTATDDFIHVILTDDGYIPDALAKLRTIYPNILKLEYDNIRTSYTVSQAELSAAADIRLTPMEMFSELYRLQNNTPLEDSVSELTSLIFDKLKADNNDRSDTADTTAGEEI